MTMPLPSPFPTPVSRPISVRLQAESLSGISAMPIESTPSEGAATHFRPQRSATIPAG